MVGGSEDESGVCWALITHTGAYVCVGVCVRAHMGEAAEKDV